MTGAVPTFDPAVASNLCDEVGEQMFATLVASLLDEIDVDLAFILRAANQADWQSVSVRAHALKSAVRTFGLMRLSEQCRRVEAAAVEGHVAQALLDALSAACVEARGPLQALNINANRS